MPTIPPKRRFRTEAALFLLAVLLRLAWWGLSGKDPFEMFPDSRRYAALADQILRGDLLLDVTAFVSAPLQPFFLALHKVLFSESWAEAAVISQTLLVALSVVFLYRTALLLFGDRRLALLAAWLYSCYPPTLWLNFTLSQETVFQSLFILFSHYFLRTLKGIPHSIVPAAMLYALAFLTKSHVLLYAPAIALLLALSFKGWALRARRIATFGILAFLPTLPLGIYTWQTTGTYILSSTGSGAFFHHYHSEQGYQETFHPEDPDPAKRKRPSTFIFKKDLWIEGLGYINHAPVGMRDRLHFRASVHWIKANPNKFLRLEAFALERFLLPGLSPAHHPAGLVALSFLLSLPIYLFGYAGIAQTWRSDRRTALWGLSVIALLFLFYMVFAPLSRFRSVTLDPVLILFAASWLAPRLAPWLDRLLGFLSGDQGITSTGEEPFASVGP